MLVFNWLTIGAFLLLCGTAIFLSWRPWKSALRQRRLERWPKVGGKVLEHRVRRQGDTVFLEYLTAYEYGGVDYQRAATDWSPGGYSDTNEVQFQQLMQKRLDAYPVGERFRSCSIRTIPTRCITVAGAGGRLRPSQSS